MTAGEFEVVIVGGGAAGLAAARELKEAGIEATVIEARPRLGGRAWTITDPTGLALDLGCGWLHSADRNPWVEVAARQGRMIDKSPPPWSRPSLPIGFSILEQREFLAAMKTLHERMRRAASAGKNDAPASQYLEPGNRWNGLLNTVSTYISGAELERMSTLDFDRYDDSGVNWRIVEGYGTTIAASGTGLPAVLECAVTAVDHAGKRLKIDTTRGTFAADQVIVTIPSTLIAEEKIRFAPALPEKIAAAAGLPLGLANKLFIALENAGEFEKDSRLFGRTDRTGTGAYHFRPFGRPQIEAYFGGSLAAELETAGDCAYFDFARSELTGLLGGDFARRITPIAVHGWNADPYARGSYSYARPGMAEARAILAAPVDDRLFFAGEACSKHDFSTAHGAWLSGTSAAEQVIASRRKR
jgi:monoamine oxidase